MMFVDEDVPPIVQRIVISFGKDMEFNMEPLLAPGPMKPAIGSRSKPEDVTQSKGVVLLFRKTMVPPNRCAHPLSNARNKKLRSRVGIKKRQR
ncbi:MAG: hypothetical protein DME22_23975 [Verrucomicrobia bacterium]|nr:MAG: hypothetical protein DME22_23975 [Verrucomicrobiota bacterium]